MPNRLEPLNITSFVGGLNLRRNQFQLAEDESPDLLNVDIDPRGGFSTRKGWQRWNVDEIIDIETDPWEPRNLFVHTAGSGAKRFYVVNDGLVHHADNLGVFDPAPLTCTATPHGADFAAWGDDTYVARGMGTASVRVSSTGTVTTLDNDGWSEVDTPTLNVMPQFEYVEEHAGYLFGAVTIEAATTRYHRLRWSHPGRPDAWREDDFIDIEQTGGRITALLSYQDHLLIFKTTSVWALFGYDQDSWQLVKISEKAGCPSPTAVSRSERGVFFYSPIGVGGVYGYNGGEPIYLTERLQLAFDETTAHDNVFVSWAGRRLWVSVPWIKDVGATVNPSTTFVLDTDIGEDGAWTAYRSEFGGLASIFDGSDSGGIYPLAAFWSTQTSCLVTVDFIDDAYDVVLEPYVLGIDTGDSYLVTEQTLPEDEEEILVLGSEFVGQPFDAYYRTRWLHAGWPDRKKSWRRPSFICREVPRTTDLLVESYRDYNETTVHRVRTLRVEAQGTTFWREDGFDAAEGDGFDWSSLGADDPSGRGADWGSQFKGSKLIRSGSMGVARAVQLKVRASPHTMRQRWGVDGIVAKVVMRRFR